MELGALGTVPVSVVAAVGGGAGLLLVVGILVACCTFRVGRTTERELIHNHFLSCAILTIGFLAGPALAVFVGLSIIHTEQLAGTIMVVAGGALCLLGLSLAGHSTVRLDRKTQRVYYTKRYCLVVPFTKSFAFREVGGFTMRVKQERNRIVYQMQLLTHDETVVPLEPGFSNVKAQRRQAVVMRMNDFLISTRDDSDAEGLLHHADVTPHSGSPHVTHSTMQRVGGGINSQAPGLHVSSGETGYAPPGLLSGVGGGSTGHGAMSSPGRSRVRLGSSPSAARSVGTRGSVSERTAAVAAALHESAGTFASEGRGARRLSTAV